MGYSIDSSDFQSSRFNAEDVITSHLYSTLE